MKLFFNHRLSRTTLTNVRVGGARTPAAPNAPALVLRLFGCAKYIRKVSLMLACMLCAFALNAATWYVDAANGSDENAGTSWETALASIQKGIDSAVAHDTILVSRGIYSYIDIPISKIGLTVLAMSGPTDTIIKGATKRRCVTIGDGSVTNIYVEGFTLTAGHLSDSSVAGAGALGGTYNNCVIAGNNCGSLAGGAGAANCTLNGCTISNNIASSTLAGTGGIVNCIASNCVISSNISKGSGSGGADGCTLIECTIIGNKANVSGSGGAYNCTLYRCLLEDNTCTSVDFAGRDMNGGKAYNCIIKANKGSRSIVGANCYNCTIISTTGNPSIWRDTQLYNCIICSTGNAFAINGDFNWKVNLYNCLLHNVTLGTHTTQSGCLSADPIFISASNLALQSMSPCIDNGNNLYAASDDTDVAGKPRINGSTVDIGAYEYYLVEVSLKDITVKQRYPWNGKVDVQFKLETSDNNNCRVTLSAKDVAGGTNLPMRTVYKLDGSVVNASGELVLPGMHRWVWDAAADLPDGFECDQVTVEVKAEEYIEHDKVQLWEGGPYWATTNIGAEKPEEYGCYFWWGDTVGYKRESGSWVATDGSSSNFVFSTNGGPTYYKDINTLKSEGWIAGDGVLAPEHDAANVQWGGNWRMPTDQEVNDLRSKCDMTLTMVNGVNGCRVCGRGDYSANSIFLPYAGRSWGSNDTNGFGIYGSYWTSVSGSDSRYSCRFYFETITGSIYFQIGDCARSYGQPVRPVQGSENNE